MREIIALSFALSIIFVVERRKVVTKDVDLLTNASFDSLCLRSIDITVFLSICHNIINAIINHSSVLLESYMKPLRSVDDHMSIPFKNSSISTAVPWRAPFVGCLEFLQHI